MSACYKHERMKVSECAICIISERNRLRVKNAAMKKRITELEQSQYILSEVFCDDHAPGTPEAVAGQCYACESERLLIDVAELIAAAKELQLQTRNTFVEDNLVIRRIDYDRLMAIAAKAARKGNKDDASF